MPRHHIVPRMLLRRFAADGKMVLATPREGGRSLRMSVDNACVEVGFYDIELEPEYQDEFPPDSVERALADFEGRASSIFNRMAQGDLQLSNWDWYNLTLFVALQLARGWAFREELIQIATLRAHLELTKTVTPERTRNYLEERGLPATDTDIEIFMNKTLEDGWRLVPSGSTAVQAMLSYGLEQLHPMLFAMRRLNVFATESPVFLTSDQPTVLWARPDRDLEMNPLGVATADAVWMPFDRQHLLSPEPVDAPWPSGPENIVEQVNEYVAAAASKWIFQHPEDRPIDVSLLPERPQWEADVVDVRQEGDDLRVLYGFLRRQQGGQGSA